MYLTQIELKEITLTVTSCLNMFRHTHAQSGVPTESTVQTAAGQHGHQWCSCEFKWVENHIDARKQHKSAGTVTDIWQIPDMILVRQMRSFMHPKERLPKQHHALWSIVCADKQAE